MIGERRTVGSSKRGPAVRERDGSARLVARLSARCQYESPAQVPVDTDDRERGTIRHMPIDLLFVLIIILVLVLMWKGPKNLPKLGEALGRGVREARVEASKAQAEIQSRASGEPVPPADTPTDTPDEQRPA